MWRGGHSHPAVLPPAVFHPCLLKPIRCSPCPNPMRTPSASLCFATNLPPHAVPSPLSTFPFQTAANSTRDFCQHFPNTNSPLESVHLEQQILSQVPCSDPSVLSDLIIRSSIKAVMASVIPAWQDGASRMVSSAGFAGKPLLLFVQQRDFVLP